MYMYTQDEWRHLIAGGTTIPNNIPNPAPEWISKRVWKDILTLPALPNFTKLAEEFGDHADDFKKIFDSIEPHRESLPGHWNTDLNDFQKMLVLKCIRADKLTNSMQVFNHGKTEFLYMYIRLCSFLAYILTYNPIFSTLRIINKNWYVVA